MAEDYVARARRLGKPLGIAGPALEVVDTGRGPAVVQRQEAEAAALAARLPGGHGLLLLDERGDDLESRQLAQVIARARDAGDPGLCFVIGGPDGFGAVGAARLGPVRRRLAFGRATWPHLLVRAMLAEQLYRALTLLAGHPYHRD